MQNLMTINCSHSRDMKKDAKRIK